MKFFLIQNSNFHFSDDFLPGTEGKFGCFLMDFLSDDSTDEKDKSLAGAMELMVTGCKQKEQDILIVSVVLVSEKGQQIVQFHDDGTLLLDLVNIFGEDNVRVKMTFSKLWTEGENGKSLCGSVSTNEMAIRRHPRLTCEDKEMLFPNGWLELFQRRALKLNSILTVEVSIKDLPVRCTNKTVMLKKMLHDEVLSDLVISVGNGGPIKCHKSVLSASSPVFEAMFKTVMKESKTDSIEIDDMTEDGVRAFLAYLYYSDLEGPNNDAEVAYELLCAAHKYMVTLGLESEIVKIFLTKPVEWYDLDVAVKLFAFARNLPAGEELKIKAVQVLKENVGALPQSQTYKEMFQKDPSAAMELCQLAFVS